MATRNLDLEKQRAGSSSDADTWSEAVQKNNENVDKLDEHDHTPGKGKPVPVGGLLIDEDLNFNNFSITNLKSLELSETSHSDALIGSFYKGVGSNRDKIYYKNSSGVSVELFSATPSDPQSVVTNVVAQILNLSSGSDLNDIGGTTPLASNHIYILLSGSSFTNTPGDFDTTLDHLFYVTTNGVQFIVPMNAIFYHKRSYSGGVWSAWTKSRVVKGVDYEADLADPNEPLKIPAQQNGLDKTLNKETVQAWIKKDELDAVDSLPDPSTKRLRDMVNYKGELYELVRSNLDPHIYRGVVAINGSFYGDNVFEWENDEPFNIRANLSKTVLGSSPPSQITIEVVIPGGKLYDETSISRLPASDTSTTYAYEKTPGDPGLEAGRLKEGDTFSVSFYSDGAKTQPLTVQSTDGNRWEIDKRDGFSGITVEKEGTILGSENSVSKLNYTGKGVTVAKSGNTATINVPHSTPKAQATLVNAVPTNPKVGDLIEPTVDNLTIPGGTILTAGRIGRSGERNNGIGFFGSVGSLDPENSEITGIVDYANDSQTGINIRDKLAVIGTETFISLSVTTENGTPVVYTLVSISGLNHYFKAQLPAGTDTHGDILVENTRYFVNVTKSGGVKVFPDVTLIKNIPYAWNGFTWEKHPIGRSDNDINNLIDERVVRSSLKSPTSPKDSSGNDISSGGGTWSKAEWNWDGTQAQYDALPSNVKNDPRFTFGV